MKQNNDKYLTLRKEYPFFEFQKYSFRIKKQALEVEFNFNISGKYFFKPTLKIPFRPFYDWHDLDKHVLDNLVFHIGMIELISYWKTTCSPRVIIQTGNLDKEQVSWWKKLYFHGLGEFFYLNRINADIETFMEITSSGEPLKPVSQQFDEKKILVPVGGGKDSVVTLEVLKEVENYGIIPMALNPRAAIKRTIASAGFNLDQSAIVERKLDPLLLQLNEEGFLNGHTPFSALLAFVNVLLAVGSGSKYIALSNESSASQSTIPGTMINHQYSKSFEFERDFRQYVHRYIHPGVAYFSFLRPLNELQIAKLFSGFPRHFNGFRSCNAGSKVDEWCGECPKCLFTEIMLSPFLSDKQRFDIFRKKMLDDIHLQPIFEELTGQAAIKPFECVGTPDEVQAALIKYAVRLKPDEYPVLLRKFMLSRKNISNDEGFGLLINDFNNQHFLPDELLKILKEKAGYRQKDFVDFLRGEFTGVERVVILGFGREGKSTFKLLQQHFPEIDLVIADRNDQTEFPDKPSGNGKIRLQTGDNYLEALKNCQLVIESPGIDIGKSEIDPSCRRTSQTELFLKFYHNQVIGVTGTKGKSTTASLIHHLLKHAGRNSMLLGNIGVPAFDLVDRINEKTLVVFELSAHQLKNVTVSPHIAVLLNIFPEHLDHFGSFSAYAEAKLNIARYQQNNDYLIFNQSIEALIPTEFRSEKITINQEKVDHLLGGIDQPRIQIKGQHNLFNIAIACITANLFVNDFSSLLTSVYSFKGLPHRLEFVGMHNGIKFYNDSISTVPESTIAAVRTVKDVKTLILGGFDRGIDYSQLVRFLSTTNVNNYIFIGKAGDVMYSLFQEEPGKAQNLLKAKTIDEAVEIAFELTQHGSACLLSPAAASYDQFHNFEHRGEHFRMLVKQSTKKGGDSRLDK